MYSPTAHEGGAIVTTAVVVVVVIVVVVMDVVVVAEVGCSWTTASIPRRLWSHEVCMLNVH